MMNYLRRTCEMMGLNQAAIGRLESMKVNSALRTMIKILDRMDMQFIIVDKGYYSFFRRGIVEQAIE